jgi:hypothetical protein
MCLRDLQQTKQNTFLLELCLAKKKKKKKQNYETLNPQPIKVSPHHVTLRKQEGSSTARHQHKTCLGDADKEAWILKD